MHRRKIFGLIFIVWVMMSDGTVWRYPQAGYWMASGPQNSYKKSVMQMVQAMSGKVVVEISSYKIRRLGFTMKGYTSKNSFTYKNPLLKDYGDYEVVVLNGVKVCREVK